MRIRTAFASCFAVAVLATLPAAHAGEKKVSFKLQNDTDTPIYIQYITTRNHAVCSIFGKGVPGRKVTLVHSHRRLGERWFTGVFYRVVKYPDGHVVRGKPYYSDYKWTPALDYTH